MSQPPDGWLPPPPTWPPPAPEDRAEPPSTGRAGEESPGDRTAHPSRREPHEPFDTVARPSLPTQGNGEDTAASPPHPTQGNGEDTAGRPPLSAPPPREKLIERPSPLTGLAHSGIVLAGSVVIFGRELSDGGLSNLSSMALVVGIIAAGSALVAFLIGLAAWRTTTFIVDDEEFRVERRLIFNSSSRVDYTKVQSVEISQPLVARLLGLAKVQIDVGGAGGVSLSFLTLSRAEALREHLLVRMRRARSGGQLPAVPPTPFDGEPGTDLAAAPEPVEEPEVLVHAVPVGTLFLGTLVSSFAFAAASAALIMLGLYLSQGTSPTIFGALVAIGGWLWANIGANWRFTVTKRGDTLRIRRGLTSTTTQGLRPERIQGISIRQDLLQRLTGLYRVRINVLGQAHTSGDEGKADTSILLPFGRWEDVLTLLREVWPHVDLTEIRPNPQPDRARWLTPLSFHQHTWGVGPDVVIAHHGLIQHTLTIVPHVRVQSLSLHQGPLQRRLRLATVALHSTDGPVRCWLYHLDEAAARQVFDDQILRNRQRRAEQDDPPDHVTPVAVARP